MKNVQFSLPFKKGLVDCFVISIVQLFDGWKGGGWIEKLLGESRQSLMTGELK